jgi:uncharacterized protein (TIGR00106 family)
MSEMISRILNFIETHGDCFYINLLYCVDEVTGGIVMLVQFAMFPVGRKESASAEVAGIIDIVNRSGLPYRISAMSTIVEREWGQIINLINKCRLKMKRNNNRIYMVLTMDDRKRAQSRLCGKVKSIETRLGRTIES